MWNIMNKDSSRLNVQSIIHKNSFNEARKKFRTARGKSTGKTAVAKG